MSRPQPPESTDCAPNPPPPVIATRVCHREPLGYTHRRTGRNQNRVCGLTFRNLIYQPETLLDRADAHPDAGVDVAGLERGGLEIEPIVGRIAGRLARIEGAAAGTPDIAASAELPCQLAAEDPGGGGAILQ